MGTLTRQIVTIGTPHRGTVEALVRLSNGWNADFGPLTIPLTEIIRSLPSAHQLLPTYPCVDAVGGLNRISEMDIPDIDGAMLKDALAFHETIRSHAITVTPKEYQKLALKGIAQPTKTTVRWKDGRLEPLTTLDGQDFAGDGTVPRISSHPPEWQDDAYAGAFGQQHATLQSDANLHRQLRAILTAGGIERYAAAEDLFGLELPDVIQAGEPLTVTAISAIGDHTLPLRAVLLNDEGIEIADHLMRDLGHGLYKEKFADVPPGLISVRVESATPRRPLDPVVGMTIVWNKNEASID